MHRKIDTVLIDYDGTIMDTNELIRNAWHSLFERLGREAPSDAVIYSTFGEMMIDTMRNYFGGNEEEIRHYIEIYRDYYVDHHNEEIHLFPGVSDMLCQLKEKGFLICLVTSRTGSSAVAGLEQFGIREYFDDLVTADDTSAHKPDPEPVLTALRKLGKKPGQAVMLGDTWFDMECSLRAGVSPVLAGWSKAYWYRKDRLGGRPDHIIRKPADMVKLMLELNH